MYLIFYYVSYYKEVSHTVLHCSYVNGTSPRFVNPRLVVAVRLGGLPSLEEGTATSGARHTRPPGSTEHCSVRRAGGAAALPDVAQRRTRATSPPAFLGRIHRRSE